jgi:hypothetical protein
MSPATSPTPPPEPFAQKDFRVATEPGSGRRPVRVFTARRVAPTPPADPPVTKTRRPKGVPVVRPGLRGWPGRGGGAAVLVQAADEWRGTTVQVCGLWPFAAGTGSPAVGVPLGANLRTGATVCGDPISWFTRAKLISNPSMFVLGLPGLGKSTLIRRICLGLDGYGVLPLILADLKPDYVDLIEALDGQVITIGRGRGGINVLDPGEATHVATQLSGAARDQVRTEAHSRAVEMVKALATITRKTPMEVRESNVLARAVQILADRRRGGPVETLPDLLQLVRAAPDELRAVAVDRGDIGDYHRTTAGLEAALLAMMMPEGPVSDLFAKPTAVPMRRDRPAVYDVSSIKDTESDLQAAALLACWSNGFAAVNYHHLLADAGREPRRHHFIVMDELWRALRSGPDMVDRIDGLTRLNRTVGVGQAMCSHTMSDQLALPTEAERMKAAGFVERAGMVALGGLPPREVPLLEQAGIRLSGVEAADVTSWSAPAAFDARRGRETEPPGRGKFLLKVGARPGIPVKVSLTHAETALNNSNKRWDT